MSSPPASPPHKRARTGPVAAASTSAIATPSSAPLSTPAAATASAPEPADAPAPPRQRKKGEPRARRKQNKLPRRIVPDQYSAGDVLFHDIRDFLGAGYVDGLLQAEGEQEWEVPEGLELQKEVILRVGAFTVSGESLSGWPQVQPHADASGSGSGSSSTTDAATTPTWAIMVPFAHPGDLIRVRIFRHDRLHSQGDLLEVLEHAEAHRGGEGDRRVNPQGGCKYFGECGGCQLQPIPYHLQLLHKRQTVLKAYTRFSALRADEMPPVRDTIGSPRQWGYRTKITPHFDGPPKAMQAVYGARYDADLARAMQREEEGRGEGGEEEGTMNGSGSGEHGETESAARRLEGDGRGTKTLEHAGNQWELRIGFERKNRPGVMDIEECPIATRTLNAQLLPARARVHASIGKYKRGATLLLRDSLVAPNPPLSAENPFNADVYAAAAAAAVAASACATSSSSSSSTSTAPTTAGTLEAAPEPGHVAITDHHAPVYERVGDFMFEFSAGSFFQNNNSILVPLLEYVREAIFPPVAAFKPAPAPPRPTHLVDTYCGSGLFGITLSPHFERIVGVEISDISIRAARRNAAINGLGEGEDKGVDEGKGEEEDERGIAKGKTRWLVGKAEEIFGGLEGEGFVGGKSCVVVDPPRKGCDTPFLVQLLEFAPQTIVYVSCNVHTQARDVGWFVREAEGRARGRERLVRRLRELEGVNEAHADVDAKEERQRLRAEIRAKGKGERWAVESVRGFDLFPQTAHVESVAVLRLDPSSVDSSFDEVTLAEVEVEAKAGAESLAGAGAGMNGAGGVGAVGGVEAVLEDEEAAMNA